MRLAAVAITKGGIATLAKLYPHYPNATYYLPSKWVSDYNEDQWDARTQAFLKEAKIEHFTTLKDSAQRLFSSYESLILIMALGIVFRLFAPFLKDKRTDPAIVVLDEKAKNVISVLSGHIGGANALCNELATSLNANPVITTATDVNSVTAFDMLAQEYNLMIEPFDNLKYFNGALVNMEPLLVFTDMDIFPVKSKLSSIKISPLDSYSEELARANYCCFITNKNITTYVKEKTLFLRPKNIILGLGCRKGISADAILNLICEQLEVLNISLSSIKKITSVDIKRNESGLLEAADKLGAVTEFYSPSQLDQVIMEHDLSQSDFVKDQIGVKGVCEPAAILGGQNVKMILKKTKKKGVTLAIGQESCL